MFKIKMQSRGGHRKKEWTSNSNSKSVFSFSISIFSLSPSLYLSFYIFCLSICIFISPLIFLLSLSYCFSSLPLNPSLPPFVYLYLSLYLYLYLALCLPLSLCHESNLINLLQYILLEFIVTNSWSYWPLGVKWLNPIIQNNYDFLWNILFAECWILHVPVEKSRIFREILGHS